MLVAIDVDSTLYDSATLFATVAKEYHDVKLPTDPNYWGSYDNYAGLDTLLKVFRKSHSHEYVALQEPYTDAPEVCQMVQDKGHDVYFISDRHPQAASALKSWIVNEGFINPDPNGFHPQDHIIVGKDKREWMRENQPDIVIDDRVRTLLFARFELNAVGIAYEQPWNINLTKEVDGVHILKDWQSIGRKLEEYI
jgi:hypothetical protein